MSYYDDYDDDDNITIVSPGDNTVVVYTENVATVTVNNPGPQGPPGNNKADIVFYLQGVLQDGEVLFEYTPSANQTISNTNSFALVPLSMVAAAPTYINIILNSTIIGNVQFAAGNTTGTMAFNSFSLHEGDYFQIVNAIPADSTLANVRLTLSGNR